MKRVLLVDDERHLLRSLAAAVAARGHEVKTASNGEKALKLVREHHFDLVVTDLKMPGLDGSSLITRLLEDGFGAPVVVMTGFATLEAAIDCLRKGAVDFLTKPFDMETLQKSVDKALARAASAPLPQQEVAWDALQQKFELTRRQVLLLHTFHATGESNLGIATRLCLSLDTVKSHFSALFNKLGVSNRAQLFRLLSDRGAAPTYPLPNDES